MKMQRIFLSNLAAWEAWKLAGGKRKASAATGKSTDRKEHENKW